jgi:hypothetical protein
MSAEAEGVRRIAVVAFADAIDLLRCLGVLRESDDLEWALEAADAGRAAKFATYVLEVT